MICCSQCWSEIPFVFSCQLIVSSISSGQPKMQKKSTTQTSNSLACVLCKCKGADEHCHGMFLFSTSESQYSSDSLELTDCVLIVGQQPALHTGNYIFCLLFKLVLPYILETTFFLELFPPSMLETNFLDNFSPCLPWKRRAHSSSPHVHPLTKMGS